MLNQFRTLLRLVRHIIAAILTLAYGSSSAAPIMISGTSDDLDEYRSPYYTSLPADISIGSVLAVALASDDRVYTWFRYGSDVMVMVGTSDNLSAHQMPQKVTVPANKDILAIAIAKSDDDVYAWYDDRTVSSGRSWDLTRYQNPVPFDLPEGRSAYDIVGIGIARNDRVYTWYRDGTASQGSSTDLGSIRDQYDFSMAWRQTPIEIVGVGMAGSDDHVYALLDSTIATSSDNVCFGHDRITGRTAIASKQSTAKKRARRKWRERIRWHMPGSPSQADWEVAQERTYNCDKKAGTWRCSAAAIPCAGWP